MILDKIIAHKRLEVEARKGALPEVEKSSRKYTGGLIAEIKRKSPSENHIGDVDPVKQAKLYEKAGASAISVLCDNEFFGGSLEDLKAVSGAVDIPVLCKDFVIDEFQIYEARSMGADMILLIASVLSVEEMRRFKEIANELGMQCLCEIHNEQELKKAVEAGAQIIGINNRNLQDFSINLNLAEELADQIPENCIKVAESGMNSFADVPTNVDGLLIGTAIMRAPFADLKIKELIGKPLLKICGIRMVEDSRLCEELGVDMVGLNFVPSSKRYLKDAKSVRAELKNTKAVGVFMDQSLEEVNALAEKYDLDLIQLSGDEDYAEDCIRPVIKGIKVGDQMFHGAGFSLIDGRLPGSGQRVEYGKIESGMILAGGIDPENALGILEEYNPLGIDLASGIETDGEVDANKIKKMIRIVNSLKYVA